MNSLGGGFRNRSSIPLHEIAYLLPGLREEDVWGGST